MSLSRREREIMEIVYRRGSATAQEVLGELSDPPGNSAVRALLRILVQKGQLQYREEGPRYLYLPSVPRQAAATEALRRMVETFFDGSAARAAQALLSKSASQLSREELEGLRRMIDEARRKGRGS
jgi:predicted transcriptional regulator